MNLFITGGTGLIGRALVSALIQQGDQVTVLTRSPQRVHALLPKTTQFCTALSDIPSFDDVDVVINLAGEPIFDYRWTDSQKQRLRESRLSITQQLVAKINQSTSRPAFLSGSATGIYGDYGEKAIDENASFAQSFTAQLCQDWENIALQANTRVCLIRTGMVMSPKGGALGKMLPLYRWGLGGKLGSGEQYWPWISLEDMVRGLIFLVDQTTCEGTFNFTAPHAIKQAEFNRTLGKTLHRLYFARVPTWILKILLGERANLLLESQNIKPRRLLEAGFQFHHNDFQAYLKTISHLM